MTAEEIAEAFNIPLVKVKRLAKAGLLKVDKEDARVQSMRRSLRCKNHLSVLHCLALLREPALLPALGVYQAEAERQLRGLGDVAGESFGERSANLLLAAAILDPHGFSELVGLVEAKIKPGISYHALGVRMLWDISGPRLYHSANYLRKAVANLKNHPHLAGWIDPEPLDL